MATKKPAAKAPNPKWLAKDAPKRTRMDPEARRVQLLGIAFDIAAKVGVSKLTRRAVIQKAKVSETLPNRHWPNVEAMRVAVLEEAVIRKNARILAGAANDGYELKLLKMPRQLERDVKSSMKAMSA